MAGISTDFCHTGPKAQATQTENVRTVTPRFFAISVKLTFAPYVVYYVLLAVLWKSKYETRSRFSVDIVIAFVALIALFHTITTTVLWKN